MKLLFDANLSPALVARMADLFPDSQHVRNVGLERAADDAIWQYARNHGFAIVSKDSDFQERSVVSGHPPKVVWIRRGNCNTTTILDLLRENHAALIAFDGDDEHSLIMLF